jgi:hypothetical protein
MVTPRGRPTHDQPFGHPGVGRPQGVFGGLSYYKLVIFFFNIFPLIMEFASQLSHFLQLIYLKLATILTFLKVFLPSL